MKVYQTFYATILFNGDSSVGLSPYYYTMELDANLVEIFAEDKSYRKAVRERIIDLYTQIDGEQRCKVVFSDETID